MLCTHDLSSVDVRRKRRIRQEKHTKILDAEWFECGTEKKDFRFHLFISRSTDEEYSFLHYVIIG